MEELHYNLPDQETAFGAFYPPKQDGNSDIFMDYVKPPDKIKLLNACFAGKLQTRREGNVFPPDLSMQQKCFGKKIC